MRLLYPERGVRCSVLSPKTLTPLLTIFLLLIGSQLPAQIVFNQGTVRANFGLDGDVHSGVLHSTQPGCCPDNGAGIDCTPAGTDDWFLTNPGTGLGVIDETNATAHNTAIDNDNNHSFTEDMSLPQATIASNNYLWLDAVYIRDNNWAQSNKDNSTFTSGSNKNFMSPTAWSLGLGSGPQKNDITDFYGHLRRNGDMATDDLWALFGISTRSADGNAYFDVEFFRKEVEYDPVNNVLTNLGPDGGRTGWQFNGTGKITTPGAVILSVDFINGGAVIDGHIYVWVNPNDFGGFANFNNNLPDRPFDFVQTNNQFVFHTHSSGNGYGYAEIEEKSGQIPTCLSAVAFAQLNTSPVSAGPWGTITGSQGKKVNDYPEEAFAEFGFNMSALGLDITTLENGQCGALFGGVIAKTRSAASFTSELKDFVGPSQFGRVEEATVEITGDTLLCCNGSTTLTANVTGAAGGLTYQWFSLDPNGAETSLGSVCTTATPACTTLVVTQPGSYIAEVRVGTAGGAQGCASRDTIEVTLDDEAPEITCPANVTVECDDDHTPANTGSATATDNCDPNPAVTWNDVVIPGNCPDNWTIERTWTATDCESNSSSCLQIITVVDTKAPVLIGSLPGGNVGNVCLADRPSAPSNATIASEYDDNCGNVNVALINTAVNGDDCSWSVTYTYSVEDDCNNAAANAVVTYTGGDTEAPSLIDPNTTCASLNQAGLDWCLSQAQAFDATTLEGAVAALYDDNCADPVTATLINTTPGANNDDCGWTFTYTYEIEDDCGNSVTCDVVYSGSDQTPPNLIDQNVTCSSLDQSGLDWCLIDAQNFDATTLEGAVAALYEDNCGDPVSASLFNTVAGANNDDCAWIFTYTFTIEDDCGNFVRCDVTYSGSDQTPPNLIDPNITCSSLDRSGLNQCLVDAAAFDATTLENDVAALYEDNCGDPVIATWINTTPGANNDDCDWTFTYTYKIEDDCGNSVTCDVVYSGSDQTPPNLIDQNVTCSSLDQSGLDWCLIDAQNFDATTLEGAVAALYEDNCGDPVSATLINTVGGVNNDDCDWTFTYTYEIEDDCGNSVTCDVTYSGSDQTAPNLIDPNTTCSSLDQSGLDWCLSQAIAFDATTLEDDVAALYEDNCGDPVTATLFNTVPGANNDDCAWTFTYTFTIEDDCGNFVRCDVTYSGSDQTPPNLIDQGVTCSSLDMSGLDQCLDDAAQFDPTTLEGAVAALYEDNCGDPVIVTFTSTTAGANNDDCGWSFTYTFKIEDDCGNDVTCDVTYSGSDQTAPNLIDPNTTCSSLDMSGLDQCLDDAAAFDATTLEGNVAALYEDNCGDPVTATLTGTTPGANNDDCGWSFTYTFKIEDDCGNDVTCDVTYSGSDQTAPVPPALPANEIFACLSDIPVAPTLFADDDCAGQIEGVLDEQDNGGSGCFENTLSITRSWTFTDDCGNDVTIGPQIIAVKAEQLFCSIDPVEGNDRPFCYTEGNELSVAFVIGGCPDYEYSWTVSSADNSWVLTVDDQPTAVYTAGSVGVEATFTLTVTDANGCETTCTVTFDCQGGAYCTFTQGFYGNEGGLDCEGSTTQEVIEGALTELGGSTTIGSTFPNDLVLFVADAACIIDRLPGGGPEVAIGPGDAGGSNTCTDMPGIQTDPVDGRIENTLVAQAITLSLNMGLNDDLGSFNIPAGKDSFVTAEADECYEFEANPVPGTEDTFYFPMSVSAYLNGVNGYTPDVQGLLDLANDAISGVAPGGSPSLGDITKALGAINDGFDECRVILGWFLGEPAPPLAKKLDPGTPLYKEVDQPQINIYPNPTTSTARIEILLSDDSDVRVELFDLQGKRVAMLVNEEATANVPLMVDFNINKLAAGTYLYKFTTDSGHIAHGRLSVIR